MATGSAVRILKWAANAGRSRARLAALFPVWALALAALVVGAGPAGEASAHHSHRAPSSYIITEAETGHVLAGEHSRLRRQPASLTKMMTLYLVFEAIDDGRLSLDQVLVTSRHAASMPPSELGLRPGDRITVRDAIRATAVRSANDAAVVLAEAVAGTESAFARLMTRKARALGMRDTTFSNASGLTQSGNLSTARDMATLSRRLWVDHRRHFEIFGQRRTRVQGRTLRTTNTLLGASPGVDGIKTGYTHRAGHNLAASAVRGGRRIIVVYMGGPSRPVRDRRVRRYLNEGFELLTQLDRRRRAAEAVAAVETAPRPVRRPGSRGDTQAPTATPLETASTSPTAATLSTAASATTTEEPGYLGHLYVPLGDTTLDEPFVAHSAADAAAASMPQLTIMSMTVTGGWSVQTGAYFRRADARRQMERVVGMSAPGLQSAYRQLSTVGMQMRGRSQRRTVYRVRFTGLDEADARRACAYLEARDEPCALVPPAGWSSN